MDLYNKLTNEEKEKLNIINEVNQFQKNDNNNIEDKKIEGTNKNEIEYFKVLTDGYHFWVSVRDMQAICTQISVSQLETIGVKLDTDVVFGEAYVNVNDEFLIYVQKNTKNPKYVPELVLLMTKERDFDYTSSGYDAPKIALKYACRVDGKTEVIEQIEKKTR